MFIPRSTPRLSALWFVPFLLVLGSWVYYLSYFNFGLTMNDEGFLLENVMRVLNGQLPLRDFYGYPPLRYFYLAGWFQLVSANLLVERISFIFIRVLTVLLMYWIARRFLPMKFALIPTIMVGLVPGPWEKTFDTFLPIANAALLIAYTNRPTELRRIACGIGAGFSVFIKQDLGLAFIAVQALTMWLLSDGAWQWSVQQIFSDLPERLRRVALYLLGVVIGLAPILVVYGAAGALPGLISGLITPVRVEQTYGLPFLQPLLQFRVEGARTLAEAALLYLSFAILIVFPFALWRRTRQSGTVPGKYVALWLMACAAYPLTFLVPAYTRLTQTAPLVYVLGTILAVWLVQWLVPRVSARSASQTRIAVGLAVILLFIPLTFLGLGLTNNNMFVGSIAIRSDRTAKYKISAAPIYDEPGIVQANNQVVQYIDANTQAGQFIFATFDHGFYFLSQRQNPTSVYYLPEFLEVAPAARQQFFQDLKQNPPQLVIRRASELDDAGENPAWWSDFLAQSYQIKFQNDAYLIYASSQP